jgi:two-component system sensor histidine kinase GlrK
MRLPRPKSLSSLMLTGFALVSVPLLLAVVIAATKVRTLSEESAALVRSGVETAHLTQQLFQQIASIERSAKLYQVLNDPGLLEV